MKISKALSVKAANNITGPLGLVRPLLDFGIVAGLPVRPIALTGHVERMKALLTAQEEMTNIVAKHHLNTALKRRVRNAADSTTRVNTEVLMFREKPVGMWGGPYRVHMFLNDYKILQLDTGD